MTPPTEATATGLKEAIARVIERQQHKIWQAFDTGRPFDFAELATVILALLPTTSVGGEREAWKGATEAEQATYDHYLAGSTRGDLFKHYKCGRIGVQKPERSRGHAFAAWMAGHDAALAAPETPPTEGEPA